MNDLKQRYFFGDTLEQAVMRAASHFQLHPDEVAYQRVEKRHGFLRVRRRVVIEVDPDRPKRAEMGEPDPLKSSVVAATQQQRKSRGRGGRRGRKPSGQKESGGQRRERTSRSSDQAKRGDGGQKKERRKSSSSRRGDSDSGERQAKPRSERKPKKEADGNGSLVELPDAPKRAIERYPAAEGAEAEAATKALADLLEFAALDLESAVLQGEDRLEIELWGRDQKRVLAHHGKLLMALQRMLPRLIRGETGEGVACRIDCDNYHEIRQEQLRDLAQRTAGEVIRKGRPRTLAPMRPDERRIIHLALADDPAVTTESQGNGLLKRVMVKPTGESRN